MAPHATADEESVASESAVEETPFVIEDTYFEIMLDWARGSETAVAELAELQQRLAEHMAGFEIDLDSIGRLPSRPRVKRHATSIGRALPGLKCLRKIQEFAHNRIARLDPEAILPLADLNRRLYAEQMRPDAFRPWLAEHSEARVFGLIDFYLEIAESGADDVATLRSPRSWAVGMLIAMAHELADAGIEEAEIKARRTFDRALQLDSDNLAARYWAAFLAERAGDYNDVVRHLKAFVESSQRGTAPRDDVEIALRLAINRARTGANVAFDPLRGDDVTVALESIARGDGLDSPGGLDWLRIIAYQQLGRLYAGKRPERAVAALREGVRRFPGNARLRLQLSYLERDDWDVALAEARQVETDWHGDAGRTPRVRYCHPRRDEIDAALARLERDIAQRKAVLAHSFEQLLQNPRWQRPRFAKCPGTMSLADLSP